MDFADLVFGKLSTFFLGLPHEFGHFIFGWLSFNPSMVTGWTSCGSERIEFFTRIGGYIAEAAYIFAASEILLKKAVKYWGWIIPVWIIGVIYIGCQGDVTPGMFFEGDHFLACFIWYGSYIAVLMIMVYRRAKTWQTTQAKKHRPKPGITAMGSSRYPT